MPTRRFMSIKFTTSTPYVSTSEIKIDRVAKTYNGKAHTCCCGCAGKYAYTEEAAKTAGYEVKVSPVSIKNTVNKINAAIRGELPVDSFLTDETFVSIDVNGRMYTAYFK